VKLGIHQVREAVETRKPCIDSYPGDLAGQNTLTKLGIHQARA
jgi:hypothetical protein